jgi:hypothetical protein
MAVALTGPAACMAAQPDLDPEALSILKATAASITGANSFSFEFESRVIVRLQTIN